MTDEYGLSVDDDVEYDDWCEDIGQSHAWGPWVINEFTVAREDRFCSKCGGMETQVITP